MATTGYQAGLDANDVELSYAPEATWGDKPTVAFQGIRFTGESFSGSKTRDRPKEVNFSGQASAAITTKETATAGLNFALSFGTYDDMLAGLFNGAWSTALEISGTDISATADGLASVTAGKFDTVSVGQWIKVAGFTAAADNGLFRVTAKTGTSVTVQGGMTVEAAGDDVSVHGSTLKNGTVFTSFFFQKKLTPTQYLTYPGTYLTGGNINAGVGQFMQGDFSGVAKAEEKAAASSSTGAVIVAPAGRVLDTVTGVKSLLMDGAPVGAVVDTINIQIQKDGADAQYGVGSAQARGVTKGTLTVSGSLKTYFKDFTLYDRFKSETASALSYITQDDIGNAYVVTLPAATIMNPKIVAGGPGQPVMAEFTLEGNPHPTLGWTVQIDRFPIS